MKLFDIEISKLDCVRYPFLNETGKFIRETGFTVEDLDDVKWSYVIKKAYERIYDSLKKPDSPSTHTENDIQSFTRKDTHDELLSFIIAVIILKLVDNDVLIKKFCLSESIKSEKYLIRGLNSNMGEEQAHHIVVKILNDIFQIKIHKDGNDYCVKVPDYLRRATHFHEKEWKLVNRVVHDGFVYLPIDTLVRLVRSEISAYMFDRIKTTPSIKEMPQQLEAYISELRIHSKQFIVTLSPVAPGEYPPCIKHAIDTMQKGDNLSHSGRFLLATYLLSIGQTEEQIAPLFKNAPDFNESITRYQINNIAKRNGEQGSRYACPSCSKLQSEGLCFKTIECNGIVNPANFKRHAIKTELTT